MAREKPRPAVLAILGASMGLLAYVLLAAKGLLPSEGAMVIAFVAEAVYRYRHLAIIGCAVGAAAVAAAATLRGSGPRAGRMDGRAPGAPPVSEDLMRQAIAELKAISSKLDMVNERLSEISSKLGASKEACSEARGSVVGGRGRGEREEGRGEERVAKKGGDRLPAARSEKMLMDIKEVIDKIIEINKSLSKLTK